MSRRGLLVPTMAVLLAGYAAAHPPLQGALLRLVRTGARGCAGCAEWLPHGWWSAAAAVLALVAAAAAGAVLAGRTGERDSERLLLSGIFALALLLIPASWVGLAGWLADRRLLAPPLGPLLTALPALAVTLAARGRGGAPDARNMPEVVSPLALGLAGVALALLGAAALIATSHPPHGYDALSYHAPLAVYFWRDGDLGSFLERQRWAWALAHPGSAELLFGMLRIGGGERLANLGQLPYAAIGAVAVHAIGRRTGLPGRAAVLGAVAWLMAPMVVVQAGMQLNDLAAGALVVAAMALAAAPPSRWSPVRLLALGVTLGLAVTTKLAVLPAAAAVVLYVAVRLRTTARPLVLAAWGMGGLVAAAAPWWIRNGMLYGNPIFPAALPLIGRGYVVGEFMQKDGWFVPHPLAWPLYPVVEAHGEMSGLGTLFLVGAIPGLAVAAGRARRGPLMLLALVAVVSLAAWWRLTQHEPRLLLGVAGSAFGLLGWALVAVPRAERGRAIGLLVAAALLSAAVTVQQALGPWGAAAVERARFYEEEWGIDSAVAGLPPQQGLLYHTGYAYRSYAGDYPLLGKRQERSIAVIDGPVPTDTIVATMRRQGYRLAYVPAEAEAYGVVEAMYSPDRFERIAVSMPQGTRWTGVRRYLFRLREAAGP